MSDDYDVTSWQQMTLGDIGRWGSGGTPKRTKPEYYGGSIPWLVIGDLNDSVVYKSKNSITSIGLSESSAKLVPPGTILIGMYGSIGKLGIAGIDCATNQAIATCLAESDFVNASYLFNYILSQRKALLSMGKGGAQQNISQTVLKAYPIPLPPLAEQKAIAEKLDTLLAQVESTKARLERIPKTLKRFRQSVLAAAVSGKLTEEWRKDKQLNAPEQLQAIRTRYPSKPAKEGLAKFHELPQTWDWALVKEVGDVQLGRQRAPKYHQGTNMRPYLRVANVMEGYIDTRDIMEMEFNEKDYERYHLSEGDILLNEGQSHELVGRPAMFKGEVEGACFTNTLVRFRPRLGVSGNFAYMVFLSYLQSGRFQQIASRTVNISHLGAGRFADMEFPFPTMEEQTEIVRRVDQLFAYADTIETQVNNALERVNNLTQSILAKAFRGELTEQWRKDNPDLISGENSAEALLEKIKAGRAAAKPVKRGRKRA